MKSITQVLFLLPAILTYYMTVVILKDKETIGRAIKVCLFTLTAVSLFAIYEFLGSYLNLPYANYYSHSWNYTRIFGFNVLRVSSVSLEPILLANYIISMLPLAALLFIYKINLISRRYLLICILVSSLCLILTFSRSSIYSGIVALLCAIFILRRQNHIISKRLTFIVITILLLTVIIFYPQLLAKFRTYFDISDYSQHISAFHRVVCGLSAINMFLQHPLLGVGTGNFIFHLSENLPGSHIPELIEHTGMPVVVNNLYLELLSETGLFGLLSFICLICFLLKFTLKRIKTMEDKYWDVILLGLFLGFVTVLTNQIFSASFYFPYVWFLMGLISAIEKLIKSR